MIVIFKAFALLFLESIFKSKFDDADRETMKDVRKFYGRLSEPKELIEIDAADHLFDGRVAEIGEAIEDLLQDFND